MRTRASELTLSWNSTDCEFLRGVKVEEDIRDALQSVQATKPSLEQRKALLEASDQVGVHYAFLGFPAASMQEEQECASLAQHAAQQRLSPLPVFMARAVETDIPAVCRVRDAASAIIAVDIFIPISDIRFCVENWSLLSALESLKNTATLAARENLQIRISLEDASRSSPKSLELALGLAIDLGATTVTLCDTVGASDPSGAKALATFASSIASRLESSIEIGWHGHNDKGLALANALAAAEGGASVISGTFLGFGERTGNIPLEQVIYLLAEAGSAFYDLRQVPSLCALFCEAAQVPTSGNAPLVGANAFSTSTGTHAAALQKARVLGSDFEDLVYSGVRAADLGRTQSILIGPNSGRRAVVAILEDLSISPTPEAVDQVLQYCKLQNRSLDGPDAVREAMQP